VALFTIENAFRYDIVRKIYEGGMGVVYEAEQHGARHFVKRIAIKVIRQNYADQKQFIENFIGEAKLVADLIHTNIVQTYHLGETNGVYFIAMELIRGANLDQFAQQLAARRRELPKELAVFIVSRVARGLAYAHAKTDKDGKSLGLVHRDVSFKNIMIAFEGDVKLTDFGIAIAQEDESRPADVAIRLYDDQGVAQGTPIYQVIAPRARFAASTTRLFPSLAAGTSGYLSATSTPGLAGMVVATRSGMYSWALQAANRNGGARTLYSPQFVTGFGYRSSLILVNLDILPASVTLRWINDSGDPIGQPATLTVPPKGRKVISDPAIFQAGTSNSGYISVESDRPLTGAVFFGDEAGARMQTALPLVTTGHKDIIYSQVAQNDVYYTGLAVINPGAVEAHLSISVHDEHGAEMGSGSETLGPGSRFSRLLTQIAPAAPSMSKGYFRVKSDQPVFSFAIFGTTTFSVLSAIPAQPVGP